MALIPIEAANMNQRFLGRHTLGENRRKDLIALKGGMCERCQLKHPSDVYQFHHRNPVEKEFNLTKRDIDKRTWVEVFKEAAKTNLLCEKCHTQVHKQRDREWFDEGFWSWLDKPHYEAELFSLRQSQGKHVNFAATQPFSSIPYTPAIHNFYKRSNKSRQRLNLLA